MNKNKKSHPSNSLKKNKILLGVFVLNVLSLNLFSLVAFAGAGVGIGYAIWHKQKKPTPSPSPITTNDKITFNNYSAAMTSGSQIISATSSEGNTVTLTASGKGQDSAWTFTNNTLNYETVTSQTTVTITADDTITNQSINIDLLPPNPVPETFYEAHWTSCNGALQVPSGSTSVSDTLWFSEFGSSTSITDGVTYQWKAGTTPDSHLTLTNNTVTLSSGLTTNTSAEIDCLLNGNIKATIQILAFKSDTTIPRYNFVDVSGYIQSQNTASYVYVTVKGNNYTMDNTNLNELSFVTASSNDKSSNLQISTGVLNSSANTVTYQVFINPTYATTDIVGNFAVQLTPTNTNISVWNSGDIAIFPSIQTSFNVSCANPNLTFNTTDTLSLSWTSANYTPTNFSLKTDGSSNTNWTLTNNGNHQLTLARQSQTLAVNQYPVTIVASDGVNNDEATITVTINNPIQTSFNVSCANPNLTFNTTDELSLTWTSANYTPTNFTLKSDGSSNTNWDLTNNGNQQLTLARQSSSLPANVYNVVIQASDGITTNEATVVVTISNPVEKDLFFTTGDTTTIPNSAKAFYGTISASNFTLCANDNLKVKVDGAVSSTWTATTFDNKTHIKITPPNNLAALSKYQVAIYDSQNDITSNAIGFSVQSKMNVDDGYYVAIKNDGTVSKTQILSSTVSLNSQSPALVGLYFGKDSTVTNLYCQSNQLTSLDVSGNSDLTTLWCYDNQLTSLDVSKNSLLTSLYCDSNQLTSLDVSKNSKFITLDCQSNQLTSLDVSKNSKLINLRCNSNQLTSLDVSNNSQLADLRCYSNPFNLIKLPTNYTGSFIFALTPSTASWTAYNYAPSGDIYCNTSVTITGWPSGWTRHPY